MQTALIKVGNRWGPMTSNCDSKVAITILQPESVWKNKTYWYWSHFVRTNLLGLLLEPIKQRKFGKYTHKRDLSTVFQIVFSMSDKYSLAWGVYGKGYFALCACYPFILFPVVLLIKPMGYLILKKIFGYYQCANKI